MSDRVSGPAAHTVTPETAQKPAPTDAQGAVPPPSADPSQPCPTCGRPVNTEILADAPACPHGWVPLDGLPLADLKAMFAKGAPDLSLDPERAR